MANVSHEFRGQHTEIKLEIVEKYLRAYTNALRRHFDNLWYIDGFAGTGTRTNNIQDPVYKREFGAQVGRTKMAVVDAVTRSKLLDLVDHREDVQKWWDNLLADKRQR